MLKSMTGKKLPYLDDWLINIIALYLLWNDLHNNHNVEYISQQADWIKIVQETYSPVFWERVDVKIDLTRIQCCFNVGPASKTAGQH